MALTALQERQYPLVTVADCGIAHIGASNGYTIELPPNAFMCDLVADVPTAFDSGTTATIKVDDGTTTFISDEDVKTAGAVTVDRRTKFYPSGGTLTVSLAQSGTAATAGRAIVAASYVILNRAQEVQE